MKKFCEKGTYKLSNNQTKDSMPQNFVSYN